MTYTVAKAQLRAAEFKQRMRERNEKRLATMVERYGVLSYSDSQSQRVNMIVSPWYADEFGNMTRTVRAAD